jgi:hypothetical protein
MTVIGLAAALAWFAPSAVASDHTGTGLQTGSQTKPLPPKPTPPAPTQTTKPDPPKPQPAPATKGTTVKPATTQTGGAQGLGSVRVPRAAVANGEPLEAGTYNVRLASGSVPGAVGQTPDESKWVEFLEGSQVRGKEVATVMTADEVKKIAETSIPAPGTSKVQVLKGEDYLRVWINRANTHYLVHLALRK